MTVAPRKTNVSIGIVSELTVGGETVTLSLEKVQDFGLTVYRGGMTPGQRLLVTALLEELIPELEAPDSIQNLAITEMTVDLRPERGSMVFNAAIENAWAIILDSGPTLAIDRLSLSILAVKAPAAQKAGNNSSQLTTSQQTQALSQQRKLAFNGQFTLFGGEFAVRVAHEFSAITRNQRSLSASQWQFSAVADNISITEIIKAFGFSQDKLDEFGLRSLVVSLGFDLKQTCYQSGQSKVTESSYSFTGKMLWDTGIELVPGEQTLQIEAAIAISKTTSGTTTAQQAALQGWITGSVRASIPFFDTLNLSVVYAFTQTSRTGAARAGSTSQPLANRTGELIFQLQLSTLLLTAVYTSVPDPKFPSDPKKNRKLLRFSIGLVTGKNPTIGDLVAYIVSLYDPSITDFELDPPWDELTKQEIALDQFNLEIDLTQKSVTIAYRATLDVLIAKVSDIGLSYQFGSGAANVSKARSRTASSSRSASNKKVAIAINLSIPGQPKKRMQWDPVNENPPEVPGKKAPIFDLQFLALGQRVAFAPEIVRQARTIEQFTTVMRQSLVPLPPIKRRQNPLTALQGALPSAVSSDPTQPIQFSGQPIRFSAESGWLIGAQFSILGAIHLSIIFNDPFIYGVRIALSGPPVESFAGFEFEILYRRISDTVGVYRAEITLPDALRYLQFGAVSVTLPVVAIEIYTNGDFGIDVGFPWSGDFSRSIAVNVGIFLGVGGFYFNKLSAETATSVPTITNGTFDPVIEFGIGLKIGLGKIIEKGPLRAELSITIHGLLQGVFATFNPTDTRQKKATYYRIQGGVAIVGRLYGSVDFKVIQVDVEVLVKIGVLFVVEVYKAIQVALVAEVSVRARIKIAFIKISFKFKLTLRQEFTLGSDSTPPWLEASSLSAMGADMPVFRASARPAVAIPQQRSPRTFARSLASNSGIAGETLRNRAQHSGGPLTPNSQPPATLREGGTRESQNSSMPKTSRNPNLKSRSPKLGGRGASSSRETAEMLQGTNIASGINSGGTAAGGRGASEIRSLNAFEPVDVTSSAFKQALPDRWRAVQFKLPNYITSTQHQDLTDGNGHLRLDIYFQPAFTRVEASASSTQVDGVALLFVENPVQDGNQTAPTHTDFSELAKLLFKWTIYIYAGSGRPTSEPVDLDSLLLTEAALESVYEQLVADLNAIDATTLWTVLETFLQENLVFTISEAKQEINGTIFPIFPQLEMALRAEKPNPATGTEAGTEATQTASTVDYETIGSAIDFDADTAKLTAEQLTALRQYFQSLHANHDATTDDTLAPSATTNSSSVPTLSVAQFIFADYFTLIMRSALQSGIDEVRVNGDRTLSVLLDALDGSQSFQDLAGMTSRFLLHGLRLPAFSGTSTSFTNTHPAYIATQQQFSIQQTADSAQVNVDAIRLQKAAGTAAWIQLTASSQDAFDYIFTEANRTAIAQFEQADLSIIPWNPIDIQTGHLINSAGLVNFETGAAVDSQPSQPSSLALMDVYQSTPQQYNIRQRVQWGSAVTLWALSTSLSDYLKAKGQASPMLALFYYAQTQKGEAFESSQKQDITRYQWVTTLTVELSQVSRTDQTDFLPTVCAIERIDPASQQVLQDVIAQGATPNALEVLYPAGDGQGLTNDADYTALMLRTHLATPSSSGASIGDTAILKATDTSTILPFLQLIQAGSTTRGEGYYFSYINSSNQGLPETLFSNSDRATITLLLTFGTTPASYHNGLKVATSVVGNAVEEIIAESSETRTVLQIPAGNLGFRLLRKEPDDDASVATDELANLYQLLHYTIPNAVQSFEIQSDRLPMGPVEVDETDPVWKSWFKDEAWLYEKVLPVYALTTTTVRGAVSLPNPQLPKVLKETDYPYYGIGKTVKLSFQWQDVYGNRLGNHGQISQNISETIGYYDPIFGINQWPSVGESYQVLPKNFPEGKTASLTLELAFDQAKYIPSPTNSLADAREQVQTDRATYQQIYFQVHDPNLTFAAPAAASGSFNLLTLASDVNIPLSRAFIPFIDQIYTYLVTLEYLQPQTRPISSGKSLLALEAELNVAREDLAEANPTFPLAGSQTIEVPVSVRINTSDSLTAIAQTLIHPGASTPAAAKVRQIVQTYAQTTDLLAAETVIPGLNNYRTETNETFESIAIALLAMAEDRRVTAEVETIAAAIAPQTGVFVDGSLLKTPSIDGQTTDRQTKIAVNATLEQIAAALLEQVPDEITTEDMVRRLVTLNQTTANLLKAETVISGPEIVDYTITATDTLATVQMGLSLTSIDELVALIQDSTNLFSDNAVNNAVLIVSVSGESAQRIQVEGSLNAIAHNILQQTWGSLDLEAARASKRATLVESGNTVTSVNVLGETVTVHRVNQGSLQDIATSVYSASEADAMGKAIATANADRPEILVDDIVLDPSGINHTVQPTDSLRRIAMARLITTATPTPPSTVALQAELDALSYTVNITTHRPVSPQATSRIALITEVAGLNRTLPELIELADALNRETNRHRTVLETVRTVGNISEIFADSDVTDGNIPAPLSLNQYLAIRLAIQLNAVADAVSGLTNLFGRDVVLADVLLDYPVSVGETFAQILTAIAPPENPVAGQLRLITDQTTAAAIAAQNPALQLASGTLTLPHRYTLDTSTAPRADLLAQQVSPATATTLTALANQLGQDVAAVAIANQSMGGRLSSSAQVDWPTAAQLLPLSSGDRANLSRFAPVTLSVHAEETLVTLKSRTESALLAPFQTNITATSAQALQHIGAVNAIYEQLENLPAANLTALRDSLRDIARPNLASTLLVDGRGTALKDAFQPSTVHNSTAPVTDAEIEAVFAKLDTAVTQLDILIRAISAIPSSQNQQEIQRQQDVLKASQLPAIQTSLQNALQSQKAASDPFDGLHRLYELSCLKTAVNLLEKRSQRPITMGEFGTAIANVAGLVKANQDWIVPPVIASATLDFAIKDASDALQYPKDLLFAANAAVEMRRTDTLMHPSAVPEAEHISAFFSPKTVALSSAGNDPGFSDRLASLAPFADAFEAALPGLKLAVGRNAASIDNANPQNSDILWAVHFGDTGISYDIKESFPFFFAAAPLSNTLLSGNVALYAQAADKAIDPAALATEPTRVDAVDLNALARTYLQAIETVLQPDIAIPAAGDETDISIDVVGDAAATTTLKTEIEAILQVKQDLAAAISASVTPILETTFPETNPTQYSARREKAIAALRKEFLGNLAEAYDLETLVQYNVDVAIAPGYQWPNQDQPRLSGQPVIADAFYINLELRALASASDLDAPDLSQGQDLVIVAKIGTTYHARIFDSSGARDIDAAFSPDNSLRQALDDAIGTNPNAETRIDLIRGVMTAVNYKPDLLQHLDFTLSPAKITLDNESGTPTQGQSTLTFFFNTQTPQRYENIAVNLLYQVNELQYNTGASHPAWLNFVVPFNPPGTPVPVGDPNHIGDVQIPIPLRDYPLPPSLISHDAKPDLDGFSGEVLSADDVRDWNYLFMYEHPDVAQDTIECRIDYGETRPTLTINDVFAQEGDTATFTISLFPPSNQPVTVTCKTRSGSATRGVDYTPIDETVTFPPGEMTQTVSVPILSDSVVEDQESFSVVLSNAVGAQIGDSQGIGTILDTSRLSLFEALVRFDTLYGAIAGTLAPPTNGIRYADKAPIARALYSFRVAAQQVAQAWKYWRPVTLAQASRNAIHYTIDETESADKATKTALVTPTQRFLTNRPRDQKVLEVALPGYDLTEAEQDGQLVPSRNLQPPYQTLEFKFSKQQNSTVETFGESALPDRKITVTDLDVLEHQSAWGSIRLARNKVLVEGRETNPAFVFQTPEIRFKNQIIPLVINDKFWDIARLGNPNGEPQSKSLQQHIKALFDVLLPPAVERPYGIRVACQYGFALATANGTAGDDELAAKLPILLTPRFTVKQPESSINAETNAMQAATQQLRTNIETGIQAWQDQKKPNSSGGRYIFSVSLFSHSADSVAQRDPNLPLLVVENLNLLLTDIGAAASSE